MLKITGFQYEFRDVEYICAPPGPNQFGPEDNGAKVVRANQVDGGAPGTDAISDGALLVTRGSAAAPATWCA